MRLLICTQAVDARDPILGFMHRWIEEFAKRSERVVVICLRAGEHHLPANVEVIPLGEKRRLLRALEACVISFARRTEYDHVFVHMNQEYVLAVGWLWRLLGKRIVLWRNHKIGFLSTRVAVKLAHTVCYTSPSAYVANFSNAVQMPIGIDTEQFINRGVAREPNSILFLGRFDKVKNLDVFLESLVRLQEEHIPFRADIYGGPTKGHEVYAENLMKRFTSVAGIHFHESIRNTETPVIYNTHAVYVNLTPSGSFDKTIGEALASGCIVVAANQVLRGVVPDAHLVDPSSVESVALGIKSAFSIGEQEGPILAEQGRSYVEREHALSLLVRRLFGLFAV